MRGCDVVDEVLDHPVDATLPVSVRALDEPVHTTSTRSRLMAQHRVVARVVASVVAFAVVVALAASLPAATHDFTSTLQRITWGRLPWLGVAAVAEVASLVFYALSQRVLLRAGNVRVRFPALVALVTAATSITMIVPVGAVPATGWLATQYRARHAPTSLALWAVLAGGFTATVTCLALLLVGASVAGVASNVLLVSLGLFLALGSAGFVVVMHHLERVVSWSGARWPAVGRRVTDGALDIAGWRVSPAQGLLVLLFSTANWLADALCFTAVFALIGLPVPWHAVLFAYAASQVAGSLVPLPGGLGVVEGGLVGALVATGTSAGHALAAAVVYRVVAYWGVALAGGIVLLVSARRSAFTLRSAAREEEQVLEPEPEPERALELVRADRVDAARYDFALDGCPPG
ncbi:MAG: hypothetical protein JWL83_1839 [Actinomycetia bacterium]|nr:hypothetical protein [Actinomycetes bacterium]